MQINSNLLNAVSIAAVVVGLDIVAVVADLDNVAVLPDTSPVVAVLELPVHTPLVVELVAVAHTLAVEQSSSDPFGRLQIDQHLLEQYTPSNVHSRSPTIEQIHQDDYYRERQDLPRSIRIWQRLPRPRPSK